MSSLSCPAWQSSVMMIKYYSGDRIILVINQLNFNDFECFLSAQACLYLMSLLQKSPFFYTHFMGLRDKQNCRFFTIHVQEDIKQEVDYKSCRIVFQKLWEQVELEDALHWMSTLGGAYSNLGDHSYVFVSINLFLNSKNTNVLQC